MPFTPKGFQQITTLSAATGLTVPTGATRARIQCTTKAVRWRDDGTAPTTTVGMHLAADTDLWYDGSLSALQFIEEAASAVLNVSYYG